MKVETLCNPQFSEEEAERHTCCHGYPVSWMCICLRGPHSQSTAFLIVIWCVNMFLDNFYGIFLFCRRCTEKHQVI